MVAVFAGGCFWCTDAVFSQLKGVIATSPGFTGGQTTNPSYEEVCSGQTGHAECSRITYDPSLVSYGELLEVFFKTHDPTSLNRQGADVGTQYRSEIFATSPEQKALAQEIIAKLEQENIYEKPIVTVISTLGVFYPAESYHESYYLNNPEKGYCQMVITPKMEKFRKIFSDRLKDSTPIL